MEPIQDPNSQLNRENLPRGHRTGVAIHLPVSAPENWDGAPHISPLFNPLEMKNLKDALYTLSVALMSDEDMQECIKSVPLVPEPNETAHLNPNACWNPHLRCCYLNRQHVLEYFNLLGTLSHEFGHAKYDHKKADTPEAHMQCEIRAYGQAEERLNRVSAFIQSLPELDESRREAYRNIFGYLAHHQVCGRLDHEFRLEVLLTYHHWANALRSSTQWAHIDENARYLIDDLHRRNIKLGTAVLFGHNRIESFSYWLDQVTALADHYRLDALKSRLPEWKGKLAMYADADHLRSDYAQKVKRSGDVH